jgi:hypothetical protein
LTDSPSGEPSPRGFAEDFEVTAIHFFAKFLIGEEKVDLIVCKSGTSTSTETSIAAVRSFLKV